MSAVDRASSHASLMDGVYRHQRHFYDLTRKYYLLGRDRMLAGLDVPTEGSVLELGCGTGRNIVLAARRYPAARFFGLDISAAMLETAQASLAREGIAGKAKLAQGDATDFDALGLFGRQRFDRVFISYALSMIPGWEKTVDLALQSLAPGGSLHIVDFGGQERAARMVSRACCAPGSAKFHVSPRDNLRAELERRARAAGMSLEFAPLYRGYAVHAVVRKPVR